MTAHGTACCHCTLPQPGHPWVSTTTPPNTASTTQNAGTQNAGTQSGTTTGGTSTSPTAKSDTAAKVDSNVSCDKANQRVGELTRDVDRANADLAAAQTASEAADKDLAAATKAFLDAPTTSTPDQLKGLQDAVERATKAVGAARLDRPAKAALHAALLQALAEAKKVADLACKKP